MRGTSCPFLLFLSVAYVSPCPKGYTQAPNGGDCFQIKTFYDTFATQYHAKSYDEAETECNDDGGGLLTSIRSEEEFDVINRLPCDRQWLNIGLKCIGSDCKWDDGAPVTYKNFNGNGPSDDGWKRCYGIDNTKGLWKEHDCGQQKGVCWVCRTKTRTITCTDGEKEYKGGCVSVHTTPQDQKTAEASCPGRGHLVSIHSNTDSYSENAIYKQMALDAGVNGTIYIGGQFSNGIFEWTDGTYFNSKNWANAFPNTVFGTCVQMLLSSEFGVAGQWTNIDCSEKQAYMCFRDGSDYGPTVAPAPKANAVCPSVQYYTGSGTIYSPNYPLSIPSQQSCEYVLGAEEGTRASIKFAAYDCLSGTSLSLIDGLNSNTPFITFTTNSPNLNQSHSSSSNVMKIVFSANDGSTPVGTGWEAEFNGI